MTKVGTIEYVVDTEEMIPGEMEFIDVHESISKVEFNATESQLIMRFHTIDVFAEDDDMPLNNIALRIMTTLAFNIGFSISNLRRGGSTLPKREGNLSTVISTCQMGSIIRAPRKSVDPEHGALIQSSLDQSEYEVELHHQFVIACSEFDRVSRFMFLYNLALQLNEDNQQELDQGILSIEPDCPVSNSPFTGDLETQYTRLRNQIAHYREDSNIESTRKEISRLVGEFQIIVRQMLPRNVS